MTKRIFHSICLVALVVLVASLILIMGITYQYYSRLQQNQLRTEMSLVSQAVEMDGLTYLQNLQGNDCRITWISAEGDVLFDSSKGSEPMENHLQREEIREALETGYGESVRFSDTLLEQSVYAARRLPDGTVLRLSFRQQTVLNLIISLAKPMVGMVLVALMLAMWLAQRLAQMVVQPLNELNLDNPGSITYKELAPILERMDAQRIQLQGHTRELKRKQREFDTVAAQMAEGMVLMNDLCHVLTMNPAAARIMSMVRPMVGINFLDLNEAGPLKAALDQAREGIRGNCIVHLKSGIYQATASPVRSGGQVTGMVLLMVDITEKQQLEQQRREFTANVSHELKTPLHAISGYAELLKSGMVAQEDVGGFSQRIYQESQRMIRLVEDILKLSRLDEGGRNYTQEPVDLSTIATAALAELDSIARQREITLIYQGTPATVSGVPHLLTAIVNNLTTNAIKYNRPGGKVEISVENSPEGALLTVSDTGIGIPEAHRERIFQRFYRVDKSHSKAVGGTGLGLSIVKHAAQIHGATVELDSQENEGTTITIRFPKI